MKSPISILSALILSASFAAAEPLVFTESPIDGIVEFSDTNSFGTVYRHFVNAPQIIQVSLGSPESKAYANVVITTSEIKRNPSGRGEVFSTSVKHVIRYDTEKEAEKVLRQILAEMSFSSAPRAINSEGKPTSKAKSASNEASNIPEELKTARQQFQAIKKRYKEKHPKYIHAFRKLKEAEKRARE